MDITAEKYYDDNLENYNLLNKIDPMTAKQAMQMMEGYHQAKLKLLDIPVVVGRSEQFKCEKCGSDWGEVRATCFSCNHESEDLST